MDRMHAQPEVQFGTEGSGPDGRFQIAVGCRDDTPFELAHGVTPKGPELTVLENPEELRLQCQRKFTHLVEEERAARGACQQTGPVADGAGKGPADVPEDLAVKNIARSGGANTPTT